MPGARTWTVVSLAVASALALLGAVPPRAAGAEPPVTLAEDDAGFTLANGRVTARVARRSGDLVSLKYRGLELLGRASGKPFAYWSHDGGGSLGSSHAAAVVVDPAADGGDRAVVSCRFRRGEGGGNLPADVDLRYALGRGDPGVYVYALWAHAPGAPALRLGEARYTVKLNERVFDFLTIDARRRRAMPSPADWDRGTPLNLKEARRLTTGPHAGEVEHKYDYSAVQFDTPAFGWSSTEHRVGLWVVNPSNEYLGGGPTKVELTGHLDVNAGAAPTLCNYWVGSHYGGSSFLVARDESWAKVVGPFLLYCNKAADHDALWKDALAKAEAEKRAWPYEWAADAGYPGRAGRGGVRGRLTVHDAVAASGTLAGSEKKPASGTLAATLGGARNVLVGLTQPGAPAGIGSGGVDWQKDAKSYQFWVRADAEGAFMIPNVRPGTYTLRAIADGVLGEFSRADVAVAAGETHDLGRLVWKPVRHGRQLWEIGVPDRSAEEFRHGDHYWQWGLYREYPREFPDDVHFVIGKSDWRKDWNYCQPPRVEGDRVESTTWSVSFDLPEAPRGRVTLRLAICGSRNPRGVEVTVNDTAAGGTGRLPDTGVMHRDGIRGYWCERDVAFDAALLKRGTNVIRLRAPATDWTQGVLYDYLRLELDEAK